MLSSLQLTINFWCWKSLLQWQQSKLFTVTKYHNFNLQGACQSLCSWSVRLKHHFKLTTHFFYNLRLYIIHSVKRYLPYILRRKKTFLNCKSLSWILSLSSLSTMSPHYVAPAFNYYKRIKLISGRFCFRSFDFLPSSSSFLSQFHFLL